MWIVALALVGLVAYLGRKAPAATTANTSTALGPDTSVPALGVQTALSPAMSGGVGGISYANDIRLQTNFGLTSNGQKMISSQTPARFWRNRRPTTDGFDTGFETDMQNGVMTQDVPGIVPTVDPGGVTGAKV